MSYRLKPEFEKFQVVAEGPFERRVFEHGKLYDAVPGPYAHRFEEVTPGAPAPEPKKGKKGGPEA